MLSKMKNCSKCGSSWLGLDDVKRASPGSEKIQSRGKNVHRYWRSIKVVTGIVAKCRSCDYTMPETQDVVSAIKLWNKFN